VVPAGGVERDVRASLVVGADGIRSTVARLVGAPVVRQATHTSAVTYGYWSDVEVDGYEWVFRRDACAGIIPTNHGQACVFASAHPAVIGRGGADTIRRVVAAGHPDLAARLAAGTAPAGARTWSGHPGFFRQSYGPGWALVGDAGYFKDPISAHGLTDALRDAELLARAVVDGLGGGQEPTAVLAEYESLRDRLSTPLFEVTERIASNEWDDVEIGSLLLQLSASMADEVEALATLDAGVGR
jgi:2-polyprenyl-6-methoxyphenol hydroxylase-like FAD-dependent oxidoreductase